jgi:hypothetical protein
VGAPGGVLGGVLEGTRRLCVVAAGYGTARTESVSDRSHQGRQEGGQARRPRSRIRSRTHGTSPRDPPTQRPALPQPTVNPIPRPVPSLSTAVLEAALQQTLYTGARVGHLLTADGVTPLVDLLAPPPTTTATAGAAEPSSPRRSSRPLSRRSEAPTPQSWKSCSNSRPAAAVFPSASAANSARN